MPRALFSPAQSRAARGLLGWSQARLANLARLELEAVELFEAGDGELDPAELVRLGRALNAGGVKAKPGTSWAGEGVRLIFPAISAPSFGRFKDWEDAE